MSDPLLDHQRTALPFLAAAPHQLLADDPGLGKTLSAIAAADAQNLQRVLVVCPAIAIRHWITEFHKWQTIDRRIHRYERGSASPDPVKPQVVLITYDLLARASSKDLKPLVEHTWQVLILDEAHYLKSSAAKRTMRVYGPECDGAKSLINYCDSVWLLTGTPSPNGAHELWTHFRALWPEDITPNGRGPLTEAEWQHYFCEFKDTQWGRQITGSKNLGALKKLLGRHMLRRRTGEVLNLPPLRFVTTPLDLDQLPTGYPVPQVVTRPLGSLGSIDTLIENYTDHGDTDHLATMRRHTGIVKTPLALQYLRMISDGNHRKMLIFAWHHEVIDKLHEGLRDMNPVVVTGKTGEKSNETAVNQFQTDPTCRAFIGQIKACGHALTLTAADDVVMVEQDWTPDINFQAAKRAHRIGQTKSVLVRHLVLADTLDDAIGRTLVRKQNELAQIYD